MLQLGVIYPRQVFSLLLAKPLGTVGNGLATFPEYGPDTKCTNKIKSVISTRFFFKYGGWKKESQLEKNEIRW